MAIIRFSFEQDKSEYPEGAYCPLGPRHDGSGERPIVLWEEWKGLCLRDRERNGYHDSDFLMLVWDETKDAPHEIEFASTRGWSYPSYGSYADATPEVVAKYEAWQAEQKRRYRILHRWQARADLIADAKEMGLSRSDTKRLREMTDEHYDAVKRLLRTKKFRSDFRASLAKQVRAWLCDDTPKYSSPLSPRQMQFLR